MGYLLAFLGVAYYNHIKFQAMKANEAQKKAEEKMSVDDEEKGRLVDRRESNGNLKGESEE